MSQGPFPSALKDQLEHVLKTTTLAKQSAGIAVKHPNDEGTSEASRAEVTATATSTSVTSIDEIKKALESGAQKISTECTKLALLFSKPPLPSSDECGAVTSEIESAVTFLAATYSLLSPSSHGMTLKTEFQHAAERVLGGLNMLVSALLRNGSSSSSSLQGTGSVWESCTAMSKVSKDNISAALKVFINQLHLLRDVQSQVDEVVSNNGCSALEDDLEEEDEKDDEKTTATQWSPEEKYFVQPSLRLLKITLDVTEILSRLIVTKGNPEDLDEILKIDTMVTNVKKLSPLADDLAEEIEAPVDRKECEENAVKLGRCLLEFIKSSSACHFCTAAGEKWSGQDLEKRVTELVEIVQSHSTVV